MKTEREQIEEMTNFIHIAIHEKCLLNNGGHCIDCDYNTDEKCQNRLVAKELFEAGYGNVSEYKAEIERLTEVIKNYKEVLCETTQRKDDAIKWNDKIVEEYENKIKQVQIDVLNKVKILIFQKDNPYNVPFEEFISANVFCGYIDELIEEVEKQ